MGSMAAGSAGLTRQAVSATAHCMSGCVIGEVLGMIIGTALGWSNGATLALAVGFAFLFGYSLTITPVLRAGVALATAIPLVVDTVSIATMELVANVIMVFIPGAMDAGVASGLFWISLVLAFAVAFVLTVPVNRFLIARGKGHAKVHEYHHGSGAHASYEGGAPRPAP